MNDVSWTVRGDCFERFKEDNQSETIKVRVLCVSHSQGNRPLSSSDSRRGIMHTKPKMIKTKYFVVTVTDYCSGCRTDLFT